MSTVKQRKALWMGTSLNYLEDIAEHIKTELETQSPKDKEKIKILKEVEAEIKRKRKAG